MIGNGKSGKRAGRRGEDCQGWGIVAEYYKTDNAHRRKNVQQPGKSLCPTVQSQLIYGSVAKDHAGRKSSQIQEKDILPCHKIVGVKKYGNQKGSQQHPKTEPFTQEEVEEICQFIYGVNRTAYYNEEIRNIIIEDAEAFFSGQRSAQEAAGIIQSRAQVYVNENR